ncbi:HD domain-containing protein [bacterium]|nr:HD domain-containing protein [bacterium]
MSLKRFLTDIQELKSLPRSGWLRVGLENPESVAAHSWGVATICLLLCPQGLDREKVLEIALLHDLAEVIVGDITPQDGLNEADKHQKELEAFKNLVQDLPERERLLALFQEYQENTTPEASFVHIADKLDMYFQANHYEDKYKKDLSEFKLSAFKYLQGMELVD